MVTFCIILLRTSTLLFYSLDCSGSIKGRDMGQKSKTLLTAASFCSGFLWSLQILKAAFFSHGNFLEITLRGHSDSSSLDKQIGHVPAAVSFCILCSSRLFLLRLPCIFKKALWAADLFSKDSYLEFRVWTLCVKTDIFNTLSVRVYFFFQT